VSGAPGGGTPNAPAAPIVPGGLPEGGSAQDLRSLGFGTPPLPLSARLTVELVATSGSVALAMAFFVFGKRRRDGEQPAPDEILHAAAAAPMTVPAASVVPVLTPAPAPGLPGGLSPEELAMPRWRRPSLMAARKADPLRESIEHAALTFDRGAVGPVEGYERRVLRYRLVRLLDQPDELRGNEIGFLDEGDEVQLVQRSGAYWLVLCPDGSRGWIHKMTLGDVVPGSQEPVRLEDVRRSFGAAAFAASTVAGGDPVGGGALGAPAARRDATVEDLSGVDDDVVVAFLSARRAG
jgi:hypothetical protein